jgi:hypothetical protein
MPSESNCVTHDSPHYRGHHCRAWTHTYESAPTVENSYKKMPEDYGECAWRSDRWHEPHEGIIGTERDDDLLDLAPEALRRRLIMCAMARAFHDAILVGNPVPIVKWMSERFRSSLLGPHNFQPGDLLIESTTLYGGDHREMWMRGFGTYITDRQEWATPIEEYEEWIAEQKAYYEDSPLNFHPEDYVRHTDHAWYIQYGSNPGDVCRWTNCSFSVVPTSYETLREFRWNRV